ncbi:MAG: LapA family protein [Alphaproteobacteria bacterium]|nr:LapA family protein [Alphaproteobacteria bacterium]MBV9152984.1 LapA family protein [Alphaproteobacteria bacterium]MBV9583667.1 LapA family protein [Alphaproteobacteria bacterium]
MRLLFWFFVLLVAAVLSLFAISNREPVTLTFWPVPFLLEVPLYVAVLVALAIGFLLGEFASWLAGRHRRREARRRSRRIASLEGELLATQSQLPSAGEHAPPRLPARG